MRSSIEALETHSAADPHSTPRRRGLLARLVAALLRRALYVFFRQIEIVGLEKLSAGGPLVLVANHVNGIVDPLLVGLLQPRIRFLAKSTLWSNPIIRPVLDLTEAIPVYRHQDAGADTGRNVESFERCHAALAAGEVIALFPEGKSHNAASLAPLKTGAARIVLEAEARCPGLGVRIVPVGLSFDAKTLFRSRVVVRVGDAIDPAAEDRLYAVEPRPAVRRLTQRITSGLAAVTVNHASWEDARLVERAADLYARATIEPAAPGALAERFALRQAFADSYRQAQAREPELLGRMAREVACYDRILQLMRLRDEQIVAPPPAPPIARALRRAVPYLLASMPLAAIGTVANWVPYRLIGALTRRLAPETDVIATYKLIGGVLLFPIWWLLCTGLVGSLAGLPAGLALLPIVAGCGYVALLFHEDRAELWTEVRACLLLWWRGNLADELLRRRGALLAALRGLVDRS